MSAYNGIYTDLNGLAQLRTRAQHNPGAALDEAATQFEALFTRMMLKTMRESSLGDSLFDSSQNKQYLEMFDSQVALEMSRGRGLGLKQVLMRQLGGEPELQSQTPPQGVARAVESGWQPGSREEFIQALLPLAKEVEGDLGISHRAVLAHAALESGWGKHTMRRADGSNAFNLFGIKADASWHGPRATASTLEFRDGVFERESAAFRAYDSLDEAMADYAAFIRGNPRYRTAIEHGADAQRYAARLAEAGYATDPDYARKLGDIATGLEL